MKDPPQDTIESAPPAADPEKQICSHDEQTEPEARPASTVDPAIEARLLRKLDWRVVTLLAFLCKISRMVCMSLTVQTCLRFWIGAISGLSTEYGSFHC